MMQKVVLLHHYSLSDSGSKALSLLLSADKILTLFVLQMVTHRHW